MSTRFLHPGGYLFGELPCVVQTVLGSCVALCAWHPDRRLLLVSHAMMPTAPADLQGLQCRYADHVLKRMGGDMRAAGTQPLEYRFAVIGGACQLFEDDPSHLSVGSRILAVFDQGLAQLGIVPEHIDFRGGSTHRKLVVDGRSGEFRVQQLGRQTKGVGKQ